MPLIQTICLFRPKEDDICALYITEFLKFIGCIVTDYVIPDSMKAGASVRGNYDAEILLNIESAIIMEGLQSSDDDREKGYLSVNSKDNQSYGLLSLKEQLDWLLKSLINKVWGKEEYLNEILRISDIFNQSDIFYYLYNEGNLKYIREYNSGDMETDLKENPDYKEACNHFIEHFIECYNMLVRYKDAVKSDMTVYFDYAFLLLRYKINEIVKVSARNKVFRDDAMLKLIDQIVSKDPAFIRIYYLAGSISRDNVLFASQAETYYSYVIEKLEGLGFSKEQMHFLYYQKGRFWEKNMKQIDMAYKEYDVASNSSSEAYRAHYKIAQRCVERGEWEKVIKILNDIIKYLLNGYTFSQIMPKQKIYAYKCFRMLGVAFVETKKYNLAKTCYERALSLIATRSEFFVKINGDQKDSFEKIFSLCMPSQPLYYKLIGCASKENNKEMVDYYYEKLQ